MKALKNYYANLETTRVERLALLDTIGHVYIPRIALTFVGIYWIIGLSKYSDPEMSMDMILSFITSPLMIGLVVIIVLTMLVFGCCYARCCKN